MTDPSYADLTEDPALVVERDALIRSLPVNAPIYMPTERIPLVDQITGLKRAAEIYDERLDAVYRPALRRLRDLCKGKDRCFVIGNGPSLNRTNLERLRDEVTIAMNGFFLKTPELSWTPTFYVVEDHLVAEDRAKWIQEFKGPVKLFPANLAYCLEEADDTIFFNLRPRKSYPHGFDFSLDASDVVYTGGTVTYSCLQLAHYLGFKEIHLIGVDADYAIPTDAKYVGETSVGEIDMESDDANHFHPDYFGKGFRWHDPNVDKMLLAYEEARRVTDEIGTGRIFNAGVGGKLEVFERVDYDSLFEDRDRAGTPRTLLIDMTAVGGGTATGEIKASYFRTLDQNKILHLSAVGQKLFLNRLSEAHADRRVYEEDDPSVLDECIGFDPEVIVYRPVEEKPGLHAAAMTLARNLGRPLVVWMMDDWPLRLLARDPLAFRKVNAELTELLQMASERFAISEKMASVYEKRYGVAFRILRNGVKFDEWPTVAPIRDEGPFRIRYSGGLADDMSCQAVLDVARAVSTLAAEMDITLEIRTQAHWLGEKGELFSGLKGVELSAASLSSEAYKAWVSEADLLVMAYNFDTATQRYVGLSFANKTPEYLASGAPVLAYGSRNLSTIEFVSGVPGVEVVTEEGVEGLVESIRALLTDPGRRRAMRDEARAWAFDHLNLDRGRLSFLRSLQRAARAEPARPEVLDAALPSVIGAGAVDEGHAGPPFSVAAHFDGLTKIAFPDGPALDVSPLRSLSIRFRPATRTPRYVFSGFNDSSPPTLLMAGPLTVLQTKPDELEARIRLGSSHLNRTWRIRRGQPMELSATLDGQGVTIVVDGDAWTPDLGGQTPSCEARRIQIGCGHRQRYWAGALESLVVTHGDPGQPQSWSAFATEAWRSRAETRLEGAALDALAAAPVARPADVLSRFKNRHRGQRCFIMGNGPSLNQTDLSKLAGETVFACNAVHLLFDRIAWRPTFYASVDSRTTADRAADISRMLAQTPDMTAFFPATQQLHDGSGALLDTRRLVGVHDNAWFFNEVTNSQADLPHSMFSLDAGERVVMPYTVAITMMQLAAYMGFSDIYLVGCDTRYVVPSNVDQGGPTAGDGRGLLLTSTADDDPNHFDPRYFGRGRRWHNPQVAKMIEHYGYARDALQGTGVSVYNATLGGDLEVFPRVEFDSLFQDAVRPEPRPAVVELAAEVEVVDRADVSPGVSPEAVAPASDGPAPAVEPQPRRTFYAAPASEPAHLIIAGARAAGALSLADLNARPVMMLASALDLRNEVPPTYVAAIGAVDPAATALVSEAAAEGSAKRILVSADLARIIPLSERVISLDAVRPLLGPAPLESVGPVATALLWAEALGFRAVTVAGAEEAAVGPAGSPQRDALLALIDRLDGSGVKVRLIH
jgi:glycosyltransferase involved in cell wall biosynthesis/uncharacterized Rossmann fold enzyme